MSVASPLKLGVLGCANIAKQFVRDVAGSSIVQIQTVASRDAAKAREFAEKFGLPEYFDSYEALLRDPQIEAVYVPLPNSLHAEWAIKAAEAGKHVLCEKPLALNREEAAAMFDAGRRNGVFLLEAYPFYFQPQIREMASLLNEGVIGEVRSVQASFGFTLLSPDGNIRMSPEMGGGALLDAGSYPVALIRLVMGEAPVKVMAKSSWVDSGVDISTVATLFYADGRRAQVSCAMNAANHRRATIVGSQGVIETEYLNHTAAQPGDNPYGYLPSQLRMRRGIAFNIPFEEIQAATGSGFLFAAEAFAKLVRENDTASFERAAQTSIDIAATLEAISRSAKSSSEDCVSIYPGSSNGK
ncbi:Gfo/Idh/MocA family protein [Propionivibrio limicola]|uniref:Gfo/Idh/MocA family protein n=1 Tax=Propionivibrio limicola TaxID=167645 RepID=UPI0012910BFC|nr:Gfo/Idh/MocA family oxidoreductase [Propionivibrio limicola]